MPVIVPAGPRRTGRLRTLLALLLALLCASVLAGCGSDAGDAESDSAGPTRTVKDIEGTEVQVPENPQRVVTLSEPTLDGALALGVKPVGSVAGRGQSGVPHYLADKADGVKLLGSVSELDYEAIGAMDPDLILVDGTSVNNRPDVLDPALLRPGRFDRQIPVDAPDLEGRAKILEVHAQGKPIALDVDLRSLAKRTPGYTGADLANVINEAALLTARSNNNVIDNHALDEAVDRVMAGPQKRTRLMNEHERKVTAYHEGGHALVAAGLRNSAPVTKITILPRGRALGYTMVVPEDDKYSVTRNELLDQLAYAMGGRVAEEIVFKDPSTGAANDIQKATDTARKMVTEYGMSAKVGAVKLGGGSSEPFVGGAPGGSSREYSEELAYLVDAEVRTLLDQAHAEAHWVLTENRDVLDRLAYELLEKETLTQEAIAAIFADVRKRPERGVWLASDDRLPQDIPPVLSPSERRSRHDGGQQTPVGVEGTTVPVRPEGAPPSSLGGDAAGPGLPPHGGPSNTPGPGEGPTF